MQLNNVLATAITVWGDTYNISLNFIGQLISLLIGAIGIVGVGIIAFSVILKLIVLPFDVYQRISMRKQNIKMKAALLSKAFILRLLGQMNEDLIFLIIIFVFFSGWSFSHWCLQVKR